MEIDNHGLKAALEARAWRQAFRASSRQRVLTIIQNLPYVAHV